VINNGFAVAFDVSEPWKPNSMLNATILNGNMLELASGDFKPVGRRSLTATGVPAGTAVTIAFGATRSTPGLDNVTISTKPSTSPTPPEDASGAESPITVACYYFGNYLPGVHINAVVWGRPILPGEKKPTDAKQLVEDLAMTKRRLLAKTNGPRILNINCWNEWTEGSYLEPDSVNGMKYLEAVRDVFGEKKAARQRQPSER